MGEEKYETKTKTDPLTGSTQKDEAGEPIKETTKTSGDDKDDKEQPPDNSGSVESPVSIKLAGDFTFALTHNLLLRDSVDMPY